MARGPSRSGKSDGAPTIGESSRIEKGAIKIFESLVPEDWLLRKQSPDYFVDYDVELVQHGEPTGRHFAVQLKGTSNAKLRKNFIRHRMERKHLSYYRDSARLPVFVILADVGKKSAHWIFAQKYLREQASRAQLDKQGTLTLQFDPKDCLSNQDRFSTALREAEQYLRDLYPGSPAAAISERKRVLEGLDPGVSVDVSFKDGHELLKLSPTKPLSFGFRPLNAEAPSAFQALIDHGETFKAEVEIVPPDSPLFQALMPNRKGVIQFEPDGHKGCIQIRFGTPEQVLQVDGTWRGGLKSIRFLGSLPKSPLSIDLRVEHSTETPKTSFETPLRLAEWENQPMPLLGWFDEIRAFMRVLQASEDFSVRYFIEGTDVGGFIATAAVNRSIVEVVAKLDWLEKCRQVARHYLIDASLPKLADITYADSRGVEALYALATGGVAEDSIPGLRLSFTGSADVPLPPQWQSSTKPEQGDLKLVGTAEIPFFGQGVAVPDVEQTFTNMKLVELSTGPTSRSFVFQGRKDSVWLRQKIK